jgi:hypothetical protein
MNHFKGVFWLLAWSAWFVLGIGLHKELPRKFGKPVCTLPIDLRTASLLDFIGESNEFVVRSPFGVGTKNVPATITVFDAQTGETLRQCQGPEFPFGILGDSDSQCRRGVLFSSQGPMADGTIANGIFRLDLLAMSWEMVSGRQTNFVVMHPTKPLIAFQCKAGPNVKLRELFIHDYEKRRETFVCEGEFGDGNDFRCFFLANPDRVVVISTKRMRDKEESKNLIEIWNVESTPRLEQRIDDLPAFFASQLSSNGRLLVLLGQIKTATLDVYDLNERCFLFSRLSSDGSASEPRLKRQRSMALSADGTTMFGGTPMALWNVDTARAFRRFSSFEDVYANNANDLCLIFENWHRIWEPWFAGFNVQTLAYYRLGSGRLIHRQVSTLQLASQRWDGNPCLAVAEDGNVYRLPLPVNWTWLALCQTVLASPLALLWWRQKRRARLSAARP